MEKEWRWIPWQEKETKPGKERIQPFFCVLNVYFYEFITVSALWSANPWHLQTSKSLPFVPFNTGLTFFTWYNALLQLHYLNSEFCNRKRWRRVKKNKTSRSAFKKIKTRLSFILFLRVIVDLEAIPETLGAWQEYQITRTPVYYTAPCIHTLTCFCTVYAYSHLFSGMFLEDE